MNFDNEEDIKEENETAENRLNFDMALYGYEEYGSDFFNTKTYEKLLIDFIKNKNLQIYNFGLTPRTTRIIRENANKILISKTDQINRKVLYMPNDERIIYDFTARYGNINADNKDELLKFIKKNVRKREVTSVPVTWCTNSYRNGFYLSMGIEIDDIEFIRKLPNIASEIQMINQNDDLGTTVLIHEMTHALVDRYKGIIKNGIHNEILSIYMEILSAYELDESKYLSDIAILSRLQYLKNNMINYNLNKYNGCIIDRQDDYIDSTLYAFALFETYKQSSNKARDSITKEINKTLSGDRQLEATLEKLNITEQEGAHIVKKHIKRLMK